MNDNQTRFKCCRCDKDAVTCHEPFYGTADRKICIKYNIRFPVCMDDHNWAHNINKIGGAVENRKEEQAMFFCELADLNYLKIKIMFQRSKECVPLFLTIRKHMEGFINSYER